MARRVVRQTQEQKVMHVWWVRAIFGLLFLLISYGFASLAIDSGQLWQYAVCIFFGVWGLRDLFHSGRLALNR